VPLTEPFHQRPWAPYLAPMLAFLLLTAGESLLPKSGGEVRPEAYAIFYTIKIAVVSLVAWWSRPAWRDLAPRPSPFWIAASIGLGALVVALWLGLDGRYPALPMQEKRAGFDPGTLPAGWKAPFIAVRLFGLVLIVPLIEELFWRSFLIRWIARHRFREVPIGTVTWGAAAITSALFALAHPEWLPALLTGLLWAALLRLSRSVAACWISHLTANLLLGLHVLAHSAWKFW
jgi:CAAX prenyl protease-like protein